MEPEADRTHVAFIVNNYPPRVGGVERHVHQLARRLHDSGTRVTVVTLGADNDVDQQEDGIRVLRRRQWLPVADVLAFPTPGETRRLAAILTMDRPDVISTHTRFFPMSFVGARLGARLNIPVIHTEHGSGFVRGVSLPIGIASRLVDLTIGRYVLRSARCVLAVSEQVRSFVYRLARRDAAVFHNAVDIDAWRYAPVPPSKFVFVGRMVAGKGWEVVLDAFTALRESGEVSARFGLEFFGGGPQLKQLREQVSARGLSEVVLIAGAVAQERLADALPGAILVNPTTLSEGFQTSLLEAVASGGQVITYDVPGAHELADDGAPVRIVGSHDPAELVQAMADAVRDPAPPYPADSLIRWGWRSRTEEYLGHVRAVVAASHKM